MAQIFSSKYFCELWPLLPNLNTTFLAVIETWIAFSEKILSKNKIIKRYEHYFALSHFLRHLVWSPLCFPSVNAVVELNVSICTEQEQKHSNLATRTEHHFCSPFEYFVQLKNYNDTMASSHHSSPQLVNGWWIWLWNVVKNSR